MKTLYDVKMDAKNNFSVFKAYVKAAKQHDCSIDYESNSNRGVTTIYLCVNDIKYYFEYLVKLLTKDDRQQLMKHKDLVAGMLMCYDFLQKEDHEN